MVSDTVIVGVLTFIGTGLATAAGLWQWQRAQTREARANFRTRRVAALKEVWEALSDLEESQRTSMASRAGSEASGRSGMRQVNLLLLRSSPFLRPDEQEWAQAFAQRVVEIDALVRAGVLDHRPDDDLWWETTAPLPPAAHVAGRAAYELMELRGKLGERYAAVLRGDHA
ncbi:hypothetical protein ACIQU1_32240 [Streptomyces angustmyceticus]|uniref:hypothetical protein n=1 Tax=Streptomyces angustmyceticus TaxID=285578 RepID=UPI00344B5038